MNHDDTADHDRPAEAADECVARLEADMRARGRHVPAERDPADVRAELWMRGTADMAIWFGLAGLDPGFAAAVDNASTPCPCCPDNAGWARMATAVFTAAATRLRDEARNAFVQDPAAHAAAAVLTVCCAADRTAVEAAVWRIIARLRVVLTDDEADTLRLLCVTGDNDFELRCRRAGLVAALAQLTDDDVMQSLAVELALRESHERPYAGLTVSAVWSAAGPFMAQHHGAVPDRLAAILRAELVAVDAAMLYPDAVIGGRE